MELVKNAKKPLVLFSTDLREDPASIMIYNNTKGIVKSAAVNMPWTGGVEIENLKDIAALTGATYVDNEHALLLSEVELHHFGTAQHIKVTELQTSIVDGGADPDVLRERLEIIKH